MIGKIISHYKILEKLGEGGMGVVYKAEDTNLKRTVALKFLSPQAVGSEEDKKRFVREAQAAAALDHPNICTVYEIEQTEGQTFIAMAYLDGQSLEDKIEDRPLKLEEALNLAMQIADGLHEAHENGIVHRDIKSSNVMVTTKGHAKIMDFGLARQSGKTMITKEGTSMGTVAYMSPEQAQGATVDHRTDIWSFGVMLYEMVTGQLPFKGDYEQAVVYSIMNEDAEPMTGLRTGVPMELERIVNKAMAKNSEERYQNVNDILIDLRMVAKELEADTSTTRLTTAVRPEKVESISLLKDLLQRRVPQIMGGYILASLAVIQFIDWLVSRYPLSPHLPDFSLAALASMIPTVLLLAYFHGKPGRDQWTRVEKLGIPINLVAAIALIFFVFQGKELGATTTTVTVQDETGQTIERVIPTSGFRKSLALFFFENESTDSSLDWLQYAIPHMLTFDLYQDLFLDITPAYMSYNKMKEAGFLEGIGLPLTLENKIADDLHKKYFITGSFNKQDNVYTVETLIYETERGKLLAENFFQNTDIFKLVDEMSLELKKELEIPEGHIDEVKDHPIAEILTNSITALELFFAGENAIIFDQNWEESLKYLEQTVKEDPTFALAYFELQAVYMLSNQSDKMVQVSGPLMQHLYRLPERVQLQYKLMYYYNIKQDAEKGFNVVKMWADLYPSDLEAHTTLAGIYEQRNQTEEAVAEYKRILELDPTKYNIIQTIGSLYKGKGDYEEALKYYEQYAEKFPNKYESFTAIGGLYRTLGDYEQAKINYETASIIEPGKISVLQSLAGIERNLGHFEQAFDQYREALEICKIPSDSVAVYGSLRSYHQLRGQMSKAIDYMQRSLVMDEKIQPPAFVLFDKLGSLGTYIRAGQKEVAFKTLDIIETQLGPPFDKFVPFGYLIIYLELEDADKAEKAIEGVEIMIQTFQMEKLRSTVLFAQGKIHEIRNEYDQAILSYQKEFELTPTDASINRRIGRCYREVKEFKKAEEFIHRNLKIEPFNPKAHYEIALVYYEMGQKDKALGHLKKALSVWVDADSEYKPAKKAREKLAEWEPMTSTRSS